MILLLIISVVHILSKYTNSTSGSFYVNLRPTSCNDISKSMPDADVFMLYKNSKKGISFRKGDNSFLKNAQWLSFIQTKVDTVYSICSYTAYCYPYLIIGDLFCEIAHYFYCYLPIFADNSSRFISSVRWVWSSDYHKCAKIGCVSVILY